MPLKALLAPVADDLARVNDTIRARLHSQVELINAIGEHIIQAGGKRLRPATTLLAGRALGASGERLHLLATVVEFIHTATLLHDDVVDHTTLRRGRLTANAQWNNGSAVLSGDFLYSRAFQMMVDVGLMPVMRVMADTTNAVAEGEVLQLLNARNPEIDDARYFKVIELKTAVLFKAAAQIGALSAEADTSAVAALGQYGQSLGMAYQLADDVLDFEADSSETGKAIGNDLAEGKPTLPLLHVMRHGEAALAQRLRDAIRNGVTESFDTLLADVQKAIATTGAIPYTRALAERHVRTAKQALDGVPDSSYKRALLDLADFSIARRH